MAIDLKTLLAEANCLCGAGGSTAERTIMALLQRIAEAGGGGTPSLPLNSIQFNNAGAFGGSSDLTWQNTATVDLAIDARPNSTALNVIGYSLTGADAKSMLNLSGTWNTTGNPVALLLAIADTASGATTKFMEFLGGAGGATSLFSVDKLGNATGTKFLAGDGAVGTPSIAFASQPNTGLYKIGANRIGFSSNGVLRFELNNTLLELKVGTLLSFNSATALVSDAATTIDQRNGVTAQSFKVYRTFTNTTNYERISLGSAAGQMIVAAETAGTGTDDLDLSLVPAGVGRVTLPGGAQLLKTTAAMTSGPGAAVGTLTDAPSAGNPDVWCPIMFNGVQHWFPCWA